jgi:hypothetical protein
MFKLLLLLPFFAGSMAWAQFSVQETDASNKIKFLGKEWNPSFFSLASTETDKMNDDGGRISTYNYLTMATYLPNNLRLGLRVPFQYNTAGTDRFNGRKVNKSETFLQDVIISVQAYNAFYLPADVGVYWEGRVYLPTSKNSKTAGTIGKLRNDLIFNQIPSRYFEFEEESKVGYFVQSNKTYQNHFEDEDGFPVDVVSATKKMELEHTIRAWGKYTAQTGAGLQFQLSDTYWNSSSAENKFKPGEKLMKFGPQVRFPITKSANFILGYADVVNRDENRAEFGRFLAKNTEWVLLSFISL